MLSIAALIPTDAEESRFGGLDLNERAALVAQSAGINQVYFIGTRLPDLDTLARLRERGVFATTLLGWPRPFGGVPSADMLVVLPARTIVEPGALAEVIRQAATNPKSASLVVDQGATRKNSILSVSQGRVTSVIGDGNATSTGILIIPGTLLPRVRSVWSMQDAIHRLAKAGELRALTSEPYFCRPLDARMDMASIERRYYLHTMRIAISDVASRLLRWPASFKSSSDGRLMPVR